MSLLPPPCDEFTTSEPCCSATRVKPAGHDGHFLSVVEAVRPQIDVAAGDACLRRIVRGHARKRQQRAARCNFADWP